MKIVLAYKRRKALVNDTHLFDGFIKEDFIKRRLSGKTFAELIFKLSERLRGLVLKPSVAMVRLEQPSVEHQLADDEIELIRTHPHKYIEALSPPPVRVVLKTSDQVPVGTSVMTNIRAGIDTLVDAFGDYLHVKIKPDPTGKQLSRRAECPLCGRWRATAVKQMDIWIMCEDCNGGNADAHGAVSHCGFKWVGDWVAIPTQWLLSQYEEMKPRFFFPRTWNTSGPWISYEDLQKKYDKYVEEKENADK